MTGGDLHQRRNRLALVAGILAALEEAALVRHIDGRSDLALDGDALLLYAQLGNGDGGQQRLGIGVQGIGKQLLGGRFFHDLAQVHDGDIIGEVVDHSQVVGDEDIGEPQLFLKLLQQIQDLGLNGDIQGRDRLVADDELGLHGQRPGDADTPSSSWG